MSVAQKALRTATAPGKGAAVSAGQVMTATARRLSAAARLVLGGGGGPRGYRREGYPEHELYQLMAGRKDRFDPR